MIEYTSVNMYEVRCSKFIHTVHVLQPLSQKYIVYVTDMFRIFVQKVTFVLHLQTYAFH